MPAAAQKAFTLIEVLVAVLILGIASALVLMSLSRSDLRAMETDAQLLVAWVDDLRDRSILYGSVMGVYIEEGRPHAAQWYDQRWWSGAESVSPALNRVLQFEFEQNENRARQTSNPGDSPDDEEAPINPGVVVMPDGSLLADSTLLIRSPGGAALAVTWRQSGEAPLVEVR